MSSRPRPAPCSRLPARPCCFPAPRRTGFRAIDLPIRKSNLDNELLDAARAGPARWSSSTTARSCPTSAGPEGIARMSALMDAATALRAAAPVELEPAPTAFALRRLLAERLTEAHFPVLRRMHGNAADGGGAGHPDDRRDQGIPRAQPGALGPSSGSGSGSCVTWRPGGWLARAGLRHRNIEGVAEVELALRAVPGILGSRPRRRTRPARA